MGPILITVVVILLFSTFIALLSRYKRCPSDKILVIYGKIGQSGKSSKCIHGGAALIWPVIQAYQFLDLTPISIEVGLKNALSKQNIRVDVPSRFTVGISTEDGVMQNAAERLLGLGLTEIQELAKDIIFGQLRLVVATMDIEEINTDRDKFLEAVSRNVESELKKIGLRLINVNVTDINDESGYIEALGKEAAAKAINDAKKSVAEKNRDGEIGQAIAMQEQRIRVADADASAVEGENKAKVTIAQSAADRREKEAEANRRAVAAEKVQSANALGEAYVAEEAAEIARATREKATQEANIVVSTEIEKRKIEIEAAAAAEQARIRAKGEADAIFAKMDAQARGMKEILMRQAEGYAEMVRAAGGDPQKAVLLKIADNLPELVKTQVEAVKGIKIDKVTVWDANGQKDGTATSNFIANMMKSVPPLQDIFNMAGMELPSYLKGDAKAEDETAVTIEAEPPQESKNAE